MNILDSGNSVLTMNTENVKKYRVSIINNTANINVKIVHRIANRKRID